MAQTSCVSGNPSLPAGGREEAANLWSSATNRTPTNASAWQRTTQQLLCDAVVSQLSVPRKTIAGATHEEGGEVVSLNPTTLHP